MKRLALAHHYALRITWAVLPTVAKIAIIERRRGRQGRLIK